MLTCAGGLLHAVGSGGGVPSAKTGGGAGGGHALGGGGGDCEVLKHLGMLTYADVC
jgi:hypothetical protein